MNEACRSAERLVLLWSKGGSLSAADLDSLDVHLAGCPACRSRLEPLASFLRRDALGVRVDLRGVGAQGPDLVPGVLDRLDGRSPRSPGRSWAPVLAMAAVVVVLAGVGLVLYRAGLVRGAREVAGTVLVRFELAAPEADTVSLLGDFNEWGDDGLPLEDDDGDGLWTATVRLRPGRAYSYNFLVDGDIWIADPNAPLNVSDGFGGTSSVIIL